MRILFVSSGYPTIEKPQYCIFLEQQALALKNIGNHVDVLYIDSKSEKNEFKKWHIRKGIQLYKWDISWNFVHYYLLIQNKNEDIERFLKENQYDIVAYHFGNIAQFMYINKICKKINTKTSMHFHGLNVWKDYYKNLKGRIYEQYYNFRKVLFLREVDLIVGVSNLVNFKVAKRISPEKVYTVYNGVDCELFKKNTSKNSNEIFRIICIANLIKIKGQSYLLNAVANCINKGKEMEVMIIGDGPEKNILMNEAENLGIMNKVTFMGTLKYEEVSKELKKADLFVLPSYFEAFGCVYLEAMACGVIACGCYNNGPEEIINDGVNGFLVREKNTEDIEKVINFVMENPKKAKEIAERGIVRANDFSWNNSAKSLAEVYMNVCSEKK